MDIYCHEVQKFKYFRFFENFEDLSPWNKMVLMFSGFISQNNDTRNSSSFKMWDSIPTVHVGNVFQVFATM